MSKLGKVFLVICAGVLVFLVGGAALYVWLVLIAKFPLTFVQCGAIFMAAKTCVDLQSITRAAGSLPVGGN